MSGADDDRVEVGPVDELGPGDREIVSVGNQQVGVFNINGEYHAILNTCLHQNGPLCEGKVLPEITGEFTGIGERVVEKYGNNSVVKCPWHGWEYNLGTGNLLHDDQLALPTFDVIVENETVYLVV